MKIVVVIPSMGSGGAERVVSLLVNQWVRKADCRVVLIVLSSGSFFYEIDPRVSVHRLNYVGGRGWLSKMIAAFRAGVVFRRIIKRTNPNVVLSLIREANIFTLLFARFLGVRVVVSERDSAETLVQGFYSCLRKLTYPWADGVIVQTCDYKKFIVDEAGNENVCVIPNPVREIKRYRVEKEKLIVNVGRLIEEKGQAYLLKAFAKTKHGSDWRLAILGDGKLKSSLIAEACQLGIADRVIFVGATKDVDQWLARSSIFAFASVTEGFPNALAEAMAAGLPCVSFDCVAGPADLIEDGVNGFLVGARDVEGLATRLDELICSSDLRDKLGAAATLVARKLDAAVISQSYFSFLSKC